MERKGMRQQKVQATGISDLRYTFPVCVLYL